MNIANLTNEDLIAVINECPEFKEKIEAKLKEKQNAELLQEEQNLADDLRSKQNELSKTDVEISFLEEKLKSVRFHKDNITSAIVFIKAKLEDIHKKWIALNPAKPAPYKKPVIIARQPATPKRNIVKEAFDLIWDMQCVNGRTSGVDYALTFKRFDNLIHNRCKTANVFGGAPWDIWDVYNHLINIDDGGCKLADELCAFYGKCVDKNCSK